jgi:hypothetical protein
MNAIDLKLFYLHLLKKKKEKKGEYIVVKKIIIKSSSKIVLFPCVLVKRIFILNIN